MNGGTKVLAAIVLALAMGSVLLFSYLGQKISRSDGTDNVHLEAVSEVSKTEYRVGEEILVEPRLVNTGPAPVRIYHGDPLFFTEVHDESGRLVIVYPQIRLDILIARDLRPGEQYLFYRPEWVISPYKFSLDRVGKYKIVSHAEIYLRDPVQLQDKAPLKVYTEPVWVEISAQI